MTSPDSESSNPEPASAFWNVPIKTAGGAQLWTDHLIRDGFRLQQNALTGHWRTLDSADVRRAWGKRDTCTAALDRLQPRIENQADAPESRPKPVVVLLHGLMRTSKSMSGLATDLQDDGRFDAINFGYASTRGSIGDHATALREVLEDQPQDCEFGFVGHSMGNIVVRHLIGDLNKDGDRADLLPRMKAMIMLGPPNQGAAIARRLAPTGLFGAIAGRGGLELGPEFEALQENLATPEFPFAIIAGDLSSQAVQNPLTEGAGDFVVGLDEARLPGAEVIKTVPRLHSFLMNDPDAQAFTKDFLDRHLGR